ncbi:Fe3+/spermidine/putrescine ABC transporter ATP-binding protein [Rhizobium altiplani]|uniref:Spermidine/putrescine import ATP-binding protein PotA n=1 Tax=Rhizobium altiplani TaxID=1864509 RepID=A0A120FEW3_9HYPH|nr:ABC transporter ATP-binding protein [Rhizobium altiplani]KWV41807.1 Fe3+/spermidine/putrescine ABC transporter ATP-binding protein [Rhizobium altiplani]
MTSRPIVTLNGVTKTYGHFTALHETNLELNEGEFVTLLGPSGCGKTTTLRLVGGFEQANSGTVTIAGSDVTTSPPYRRPVNTVFQDYALFPHMTVAENVGYGLSVKSNNVPRAERANRVEQALALVGLEAFGSRRPGALSGGQRQRVAMARAIVRRPRVLLLDEPLSALDVKLRESMQVELKRLHRELGITFLMVTHDQDEALALSDRIVVMQQGRIVQTGAPTDLYDNPRTTYVADFIGASNLFPATLQSRSKDTEAFTLQNGLILKRERIAGQADVAACPGTRVQLGIRPERLRLDPVAGANEIEARVVDSLFHGDRVRLEFTLVDDTKPFFADVPRAAARYFALEPGSPVKLHVEPRDVMFFLEEAR